MTIKLKSPERINLLKWGENLRENPKTILLSIPVFVLSLFVEWLQHDQEGMAASWGHMGIAYKNYYKHNWKNKLLLKKALFCFEKSAKLATGNGVPTVLLKCAETAKDLGSEMAAEKYFKKAVSEAEKRNDLLQKAYVQASYGRFKIEQGLGNEAGKMIEDANKVLGLAVKKEPESLYLHVWYSQALIIMGEYYLMIGNKNKAREYGETALEYSRKFNLGFRIHDCQIFLRKVNGEK